MQCNQCLVGLAKKNLEARIAECRRILGQCTSEGVSACLEFTYSRAAIMDPTARTMQGSPNDPIPPADGPVPIPPSSSPKYIFLLIDHLNNAQSAPGIMRLLPCKKVRLSFPPLVCNRRTCPLFTPDSSFELFDWRSWKALSSHSLDGVWVVNTTHGLLNPRSSSLCGVSTLAEVCSGNTSDVTRTVDSLQHVLFAPNTTLQSAHFKHLGASIFNPLTVTFAQDDQQTHRCFQTFPSTLRP
jgi:hypothetical protein